MRQTLSSVLLVLLIGTASARAAYAVSDDFSTNPLLGGSPWTFGAGSNANSQFTWNAGELSVHIDTSLPTARLDLPLGANLSDTDSFLLRAQFQFNVEVASPFQFAQFAFGLTNHTLTGGDRTGTIGNFASDNTFHTVEFNYYPNVSPQFGGPTLSPAVFGAPLPNDAFANFTSVFGSTANLGDNAVGITELPQDTPLEAQLAYDGASKVLTLSMFTVGPGNVLTLLNTELVPLDLVAFGSGYDSLNSFLVDSLSIMAYQDGYTTAEDPSLVADVRFDFVSLTLVPEPSTLVLGLVAGLFALHIVRRSRKSRMHWSTNERTPLHANLHVCHAGRVVVSRAIARAGSFAPAAGQAGSTAIANNSPSIVAWASGFQDLVRRPQDITNPGGALASFGTGNEALGPASGVSTAVVSLGDGGSITLTFAQEIYDGPGFDLAVFENGITDTFLELAFVEVSSNGIDFARFAAVSQTQTATQVGSFGALDATNLDNLAGKYRAGFGTPFDLAQLAGVSPNVDVTTLATCGSSTS